MTTGLVVKEIKVGDEILTYQFEQFNTTLAIRTLARLTKIIGEPLAIAMAGSTGGDFDVSGDVMGKAVKALVDRLDEKEVLELLKLLAADKALCGENGGKINFDEHYRGNIRLLFKVFQAALEVQYGNFIGAVRESFPGTTAKIPPGGIIAK